MRRRTQDLAFQLFPFQDIITSVMGIIVLVVIVLALELASRQLGSPEAQQRRVATDVEQSLEMAADRIADLRTRLAAQSSTDSTAMTTDSMEQQQRELDRSIPLVESEIRVASRQVASLRDRRNKAGRELQEFERRDSRHAQEEELKEVRRLVEAYEGGRKIALRVAPMGGAMPWIVEVDHIAIRAARIGPRQKPIMFDGSNEESRIEECYRWAAGRNPSEEYFHFLIKPGGIRSFQDLEEKLRKRGFRVGVDLIGPHQAAIDADEGIPQEPLTR